MSDLQNTGPENVLSARDSMGDDDPAPEGASVRSEREGLPRGYRMRADRHYVEQLAFRSAGQPVRMLSLDDIDNDSSRSFSQGDIEPLIQSIRTHGVLHPLLVRRNVARYSVITGRRRLAAALCLRLPSVPCLVHDVDDAQAAALAQADNLIMSDASETEAESDLVTSVRRMATRHLETAQAAAELISGGAPMARAVLDLVKAHMWRASRLLDAASLIANVPLAPGQNRIVPTIVEQVVGGFGAEARLNGFTIRAQMLDGASSVPLDQNEVLAGVSGAVLATLPLVEQVEQPTILITVAATRASTTLDVTQAAVSVSPSLARRFFDKSAGDRPGGCCAVAGALAAKSLAERHGGQATFEMGTSERGGIRILLPRRW